MSILKEQTSTTPQDSKVYEFQNNETLIRKALAQFPSGVSVLALDFQGEKHAIVASSFMVGVSLDPCLVAVAIQKSSVTWPHMRKAPTLGVSIFATDQDHLTRQLAGRDRTKRFEKVSIETNEAGALYIDEAAMWLETSIYSEVNAGDHWLILLEVSRLGFDEKTDPLLWHGSRFRKIATEVQSELQ